jgi:putative membrane protein
MGIFLVGLGALMSALAYIKYRKVKNQINNDTWYHSSTLDTLLTLAVVGVGILLVVYLIYSH